MSRPQFLYLLGDGLAAYADTPACLTIQQRDPLGVGPDGAVYLDRADLKALRDALDNFLTFGEDKA